MSSRTHPSSRSSDLNFFAWCWRVAVSGFRLSEWDSLPGWMYSRMLRSADPVLRAAALRSARATIRDVIAGLADPHPYPRFTARERLEAAAPNYRLARVALELDDAADLRLLEPDTLVGLCEVRAWGRAAPSETVVVVPLS